MDVKFNIDPDEFQSRKRRRISTMTTSVPPPPKVAPTSAPGVHEIATFLPGRLEFEHELDNEAEDLVKDLEFGICHAWGGDQIVEDENDADVRARARIQEERKTVDGSSNGSQLPANGVNGIVNGNGHHSMNGESHVKSEEPSGEQQGSAEDDPNAEEATLPPPFETEDSLAFKLTLLEMYNQRVDKRREAKAIMYERGLLEYKKVCLCSCACVRLTPLPLLRCKLLRRNARRKRRISCSGFGRSLDCRLPTTSKFSLLIFFVRY
jgi:transcriptional adapter 2-alpha